MARQSVAGAAQRRPGRLADGVYARLKAELTEFRLMPGERFSENEIAARLAVSRTPVREALYRLGQEGYLRVANKSGWTVNPLDFDAFENLYELRTVLELAALKKLCERVPMPDLEELRAVWLVSAEERETDPSRVSALDERFHTALVEAAGNAEIARVHRDVTERIRVIRRLDFMYPERIRATYTEHAQVLRNVLRRKIAPAELMLRAHIETSRQEVRKISLAKLYEARDAASRGREAAKDPAAVRVRPARGG